MNPGRIAMLALLASCAASPPQEEDEARVYYPEPPAAPRILFLRSVARADDVQPPEASGLDKFLFGQDAAPPRPISQPCDIAFRDGAFLVTDTQAGAIYKIDFANQKVDMLVPEGRASLRNPMGLCLSDDGLIYVADKSRRQILVLDSKFGWRAEYGPWGAEGESGPTDVAITAQRIYVADPGSRCVRILKRSDGSQVGSLGDAEIREQQMYGPVSVTVDDEGYVYVLDSVYQKITVWDRNDAFVCALGGPGDGPGYFGRPKDVACLDNKLWVIDSLFNKGQVLALNGSFLTHFGKPGNGPGDFYLPRKVWVGREGLELFRDQIPDDFVAEHLVVVTNSYTNKVAFYALGKSTQFEYDDYPLPSIPSAPPEPPQADDTSDER